MLSRTLTGDEARAAVSNAPVPHRENTLIGDSILPVQDEVLTSQGKPFKWGFIFLIPIISL